MIKRFFACIIALWLLLSAVTLSVSAVSVPFRDVAANAWYQNAVEFVYEHKVMNGISSTTFEPNSILTRAQVAQVLYNLEEAPIVTGSSSFTDVIDAEQWCYRPVLWAQKNGVVQGCEDGTFRPQVEVTCQEFAQMLYNYSKFKGYNLTDTGSLHIFPYVDSVSSRAETALSWANGNDLINGSEGYLLPQGLANRAQAASILMKFLQNVVDIPMEEPEVGEINSGTLPKSLSDFLERFVVYYRNPPISYEGEYGKEYVSHAAAGGTSNIVASIVNVATCVDFSVYPGVAPQYIWDGEDPVCWSIFGDCALL